MYTGQSLILRPYFGYLFSYVWLAGELVLISSLILFFFPSFSLLFTTLFMLSFARLYYWFNFSPETSLQTFFILGIVPLIRITELLGCFDHYLLILLVYVSVMLTFGIVRISRIEYNLNRVRVLITFTTERGCEIDHTRPVEMRQHSRGKLLNFGCILIPIVNATKINESLIYSLLFGQRNRTTYSGMLRVDGIKNPDQVLHEVKQVLNYEN